MNHFFITALFIFACSSQSIAADQESCKFGPPASQLDGTWVTSVQNQDMRVDVSYTIKGNHLKLTNHCEGGGYSMNVGVESRIERTNTQVNILDAATDRADRGRYYCSIGLSRSVMNYSFRGSCLVLSAGGVEAVLDKKR